MAVNGKKETAIGIGSDSGLMIFQSPNNKAFVMDNYIKPPTVTPTLPLVNTPPVEQAPSTPPHEIVEALNGSMGAAGASPFMTPVPKAVSPFMVPVQTVAPGRQPSSTVDPVVKVNICTSNHGRVVKRFDISDNEKGYTKEGGGALSAGHIHTHEGRFNEICGLLYGMKSNQLAFTSTSYNNLQTASGGCESAPLVSERRYNQMRPDEQVNVRVRSKLHQKYELGVAGLFVVDYDVPGDNVPVKPVGTPLDQSRVFEIFEQATPELRAEGMPRHAACSYASSSSYIYRNQDGAMLVGPGGSHLVLPLQDTSDAPRFAGIVFRRLWLLGYGWIQITGAGSMLSRTVIDLALPQPQQPLFSGGAECGEGLEQRRPPPLVHEGTCIDSALVPNLTQAEEQRYTDMVAAAKKNPVVVETAAKVKAAWLKARGDEAVELHRAMPSEERKALEEAHGPITIERVKRNAEKSIEHRELLPTMLLYFDDAGVGKEGRITVGEVLADPQKYDKKTLADPVEPSYGACAEDGIGRGKAKFYCNADGDGGFTPKVHSQAHGGITYSARLDLEAINAQLKAAMGNAAGEMEGRVAVEERWLALTDGVEIDTAEMEAVLKAVKKDTGLGMRVLRGRLKERRAKQFQGQGRQQGLQGGVGVGSGAGAAVGVFAPTVVGAPGPAVGGGAPAVQMVGGSFDIDNPVPLLGKNDIAWHTPDITLDEHGKLGTIKKTDANFAQLCAAYGARVEFNLMTHAFEIGIAGHTFSGDDPLNHARNILKNACVAADYGITRFDEQVNVMGNSHSYHPAMRWLESMPAFDPVNEPDYLEELTRTIMVPVGGEHARGILFNRWMVSLVAILYGWKTNHFGDQLPKGVLTLTGPQNIGKTSFFRSLVPDASWFLEGMILDPKDRDSVKQATSVWITELGEVDATFRKSDIAALKAFIAKTRDTYRTPYAHDDSNFSRRTGFCASVNKVDFLVDETGNSRFWPITVDKIDFEALNAMKTDGRMNRVWKQVQYYYELCMQGAEGCRWWLADNDLALLDDLGEVHREVPKVETTLEDIWDWGAPQATWRFLTTTEVAQELGVGADSRGQYGLKAILVRLLKSHTGQKNPHKREGLHGKRWLVPPRGNDHYRYH